MQYRVSYASESLDDFRYRKPSSAIFHSHHHFLIDGRDGCVEIVAERYNWSEWMLPPGCDASSVLRLPPVDHGEWTGVTSACTEVAGPAFIQWSITRQAIVSQEKVLVPND